MADEVIESEIQTVSTEVGLHFNDDGYEKISKHGVIIAAESDGELAIYARICLRAYYNRGQAKKIAYIGAGTMVCPRLLRSFFGTHDVYEIEQGLVTWLQSKPRYNGPWNYIVGDYRNTFPLSGMYDVIIYDLDTKMDRTLLMAHLNVDGLLLKGGN